jgi:hypothetical protein
VPAGSASEWRYSSLDGSEETMSVASTELDSCDLTRNSSLAGEWVCEGTRRTSGAM